MANKENYTSLYEDDDVISAIEDFFDQWDPSTTTPMEEAYGLQQPTLVYIIRYL